MRYYQEGGLASLPAAQEVMPQPQGSPEQDQQLVKMAIAAIQGQVPNAQQVIQAFIQRFGEEAFADLIARVQGGVGTPPQGPQEGNTDTVPAMLTEGEFVLPRDVVSKIGGGSPEVGGEELQEMMRQIRSR